MKKSIFLRITLIMLPFLILIEFISLLAAYSITYESVLRHARKTVDTASKIAAEYFSMYDPYDYEDYVNCNIEFTKLCKYSNLAYIYAIIPNEENGTLSYLSLGFGDNAEEVAKTERYSGIVIKTELPEKAVAALHGAPEEDTFNRVNNQYGETIIHYSPVQSYFNNKTKEFVDETVSVVGAEITVSQLKDSTLRKFNEIVFFTLLCSSLLVIMFALLLYHGVSKPIRRISRRMSTFSADEGRDFKRLTVKGKNELAEMSAAFNSMAEKITTYIDELSELTREKHTREAELNIANDIQVGLLQPPQHRGHTYDISAYMLPAKDVGGDLYDYQFLPDGKIFFAIADVSGKGVAAALFMSRAVTLIHQLASSGYSPARILTEFNNSLAAFNPNGYFITAFVAIFDPATFTLTYSNAGHNVPYLLNDRLQPLDETHGMAAGIFEGEDYGEAAVKMNIGDTLFLYTDGVTEAKNRKGELFGEERLEQELKRHLQTVNDDLIEDVRAKMIAFSDGAARHDDITMLTFRLIADLHHFTTVLPAETGRLTEIKALIKNHPLISEDAKDVLMLAAEEIFVNICSYAYPGKEGTVELTLDVTDKLRLTFKDSGIPFDPTGDVLDIEDYDVENSIGGLGRFLTFSMVDEYAYEYRDGQNILTIALNRKK